MTNRETTTIRSIRVQLMDLAERLANRSIGVHTISKANASSDLYCVANLLREVAGDSFGDRGDTNVTGCNLEVAVYKVTYWLDETDKFADCPWIVDIDDGIASDTQSTHATKQKAKNAAEALAATLGLPCFGLNSFGIAR